MVWQKLGDPGYGMAEMRVRASLRVLLQMRVE